MPYELLKSESMYAGRAFNVRRDTLRLPNGRESRLDIIEHVGSVVVLPVDDGGNLLFVRQYRQATGGELLELPAGTRDGGNEDPETCARREVREETGMAAGELLGLGGFYLAPGYSTEYMHVFLATGLYPAPLEADADEFIQVVPIPVAEAVRRAECGEIPDAKSLAAILLAKPRLEKLSKA